ncbi:MAG: methionyl-tRNA formyltransferase [Firmicutes bacterium]|nr:methionyl-tRNA formyltransferase [Bacillota bacterium]
MRIVYMGTPAFALAPLKALYNAGYDIPLVVAKPDKPQNRGKKIQSCPVKLAALEMGLRVETPDKLKDNEEFLSLLQEINPDAIIVAAYGKILPKSILDIPRLGCINIHGSLLPKYRGAAPIQRAVMNGESETGVTLMYMAEGMDTGDMIAKAKTEVGLKTSDELFEELSVMGSDLLLEYLPKIEDGTAPREKQDESQASLAPMVYKEEIDWSKSAREIACHIRGCECYSFLKGLQLKIHFAVESDGNGAAGTVIRVDRNTLEIACGSGSVLIKKLQLQGKKAMETHDFLLGNRIEAGTVLG